MSIKGSLWIGYIYIQSISKCVCTLLSATVGDLLCGGLMFCQFNTTILASKHQSFWHLQSPGLCIISVLMYMHACLSKVQTEQRLPPSQSFATQMAKNSGQSGNTSFYKSSDFIINRRPLPGSI